METFEALGSAVSMRWLKPDPVPDDLVEKLIWAATHASSPSNSQAWDFVVVKDPKVGAEIAGIIKSRMDVEAMKSSPLPENPTQRRILEGVRYLVEHMEEVPVWIFVCGNNVYPPENPQERMMYSAAYGAAQNIMVAVRDLGLGATYTTFHLSCEDDLKALLGIPAETRIIVTLPVGWPARKHGSLTRKPLESVLHYDHW